MVQKTTQQTDLKLKFLKILLVILTQLPLNAALCQTTSKKLPKPTPEQVKNAAPEKGLAYLEGNFKKVGSRLDLKESIDCVDAAPTPNRDCTCAWQQRFEGGIVYRYNECTGSVVETTITFSDYDTKEVIELVAILFKTDTNVWNRERTQYKPKADNEPKEEDHTCDYEIQQEKGMVKLICICGSW